MASDRGEVRREAEGGGLPVGPRLSVTLDDPDTGASPRVGDRLYLALSFLVAFEDPNLSGRAFRAWS